MITQVIKILTLIKPPSPHPDHIMVRSGGIPQQLIQMLTRDASGKGIRRDPVRTFRKNGHAVNHKCETLPKFILLLLQFQGAQSKLKIPYIQDGLI